MSVSSASLTPRKMRMGSRTDAGHQTKEPSRQDIVEFSSKVKSRIGTIL